MRRAFASVLVLLTVFSVCSAKEKFNVDFTVGWDGCYRPSQWTPIDVTIGSNLTKAFEGGVIVSAAQDELIRMTVSQGFVLTPDLPRAVPLVTKFAYDVQDCRVSIVNNRGRERWGHRYKLGDFAWSQLRTKTVGSRDMLIGLSGRPGFDVLSVPKHSICQGGERQSGSVYLRTKLSSKLPWDWTGYASLDLLVLYDLQWSSMRPEQAQAISRWVSNGGRLLVVMGANPLPREHPLAKLLPFEFGQPREITIPPATLNKWTSRPSEQSEIVAWPVSSVEKGPLCEMEFHQTSRPLFISDAVGFGRVGVLAFDPSVLKARESKYAVRFWVEHFAALLADEKGSYRQIEYVANPRSDNREPDFPAEFSEPGMSDQASNNVIAHLQTIRELRPLSIWWVILLLSGLALLLGPVDYLVLKRLGRLPLTWITSACYIAVFTVGAYYGVLALRAGEMQVRAVTVTDGIGGTGDVWCTTYSGIFAPNSAEYHLARLGKDQWWSGVTSREHEGFGGGGMSGRNIYCAQRDGGNLPTALPISIWTMQCLICERPDRSLPIKATVQRQGQQLQVSVENTSDRPVSRGYVRLGDNWVMQFGPIEPGQKGEFKGKVQKTRGWSSVVTGRPPSGFDTLASGLRPDVACFAQGVLPRSRGIEAYLSKGAAVVCVMYTDADLSFRVADRTHDRNHVELVRLVVFPE